MEFFDSHSHYNDLRFDEDREDVLESIYANNITKAVVAGYSVEKSLQAIEIANLYDFIYATCGISPNDLEDVEKYGLENSLQEIRNLARDKKVVAIGEIGLDYYWNKENDRLQKQVFIKQIELANEVNKPIVIHSRDAWIDTIEILRNNLAVKKGIFHCAQLNMELIKNAVELDYYISFAGPITFKNTKNANQIIDMVPLNRILIETDCPYLSPEPLRGTRNNSINVKLVAQKISEAKGIALEEVAKSTYDNAMKIFGIDM